MNLTRLAFREISGNSFRNWAIVVCAFLVTSLSLATVLITQGAGDSLRLAQEKLGADIVVVPEGAELDIEGALLVGSTVQAWMPAANVNAIASVPGVFEASPQLYMATIAGSSYSSEPNMFVVGYDPSTDFTIRPWLAETDDTPLGLGDSIGGASIAVPAGEQKITLYGYEIELMAILEPTGTTLDQSLFVTFETARALAQVPGLQEQQGFTIPDDSVSSVMVKVAPGFDPAQVVADIRESVPGASPINSSDLFGSFRDQMQGQQAGMLAILGVVLALSLAVVMLMFSMAVNERRREIGVLRALGATRASVVRSLLTTAALLALTGGVVGIVLSSVILFFFRGTLSRLLGFPFLFPSLTDLVVLALIGLAAALVGVLLAAFIPAYRFSRHEPAISMRE